MSIDFHLSILINMPMFRWNRHLLECKQHVHLQLDELHELKHMHKLCLWIILELCHWDIMYMHEYKFNVGVNK